MMRSIYKIWSKHNVIYLYNYIILLYNILISQPDYRAYPFFGEWGKSGHHRAKTLSNGKPGWPEEEGNRNRHP